MNKPAIKIPLKAGARRDLTVQEMTETAAIIERGADKQDKKEENKRKPGRPPSKNAFDSTLPSITCAGRTTEMVELLARELDRSVAWIMRDLINKQAEKMILAHDLEHKLKL